jgi:hypothetical protein
VLFRSGIKCIEENFKDDMLNGIIKSVEEKIKKDNRKKKEIARRNKGKKLNEDAKGAIDHQLAQLDIATANGEKILAEIKTTKSTILALATEIGTTTNTIKTMLNDMESAQKKVDQQKTKTLEFTKTFDNAIKTMKLGSKIFSTNISELSSKDIKENLEAIPMQATADIGEIFTEMMNIHDKAIVLYNNINIMIDDLKPTIGNDARINIATAALQNSLSQIGKSYDKMKRSAEPIIGLKMTNDDKLQRILNATQEIESKEANVRKTVVNETITKLDSIKALIPQEIQHIQAENENIKKSEDNILRQLTKALVVIVQNKSRLDRNFESQMQNFEVNIADSIKNLKDSRAKA